MRNNISVRSYATMFIGAFVLLFVVGYALLQAYPYLAGPKLSVTAQKEADGLIHVSGATKRVSGVWINDLPIPTTETGTFSVERAFPGGYTVVTVRALDRFGREREKTLTFVNEQHTYASEEKSNEINQENTRESGNEGGEEISNS